MTEVVSAFAVANRADSHRRFDDAIAEASKRLSGAVGGFIIFLTRHHQPHFEAMMTAIAERLQCLNGLGALVEGVANEASWCFDRPALAALLWTDRFADDPIALCFNSQPAPENTQALGLQLEERPWFAGQRPTRATLNAPGQITSLHLAHPWTTVGEPIGVGAADGLFVHRWQNDDTWLRSLPPSAHLLLHQLPKDEAGWAEGLSADLWHKLHSADDQPTLAAHHAVANLGQHATLPLLTYYPLTAGECVRAVALDSNRIEKRLQTYWQNTAATNPHCGLLLASMTMSPGVYAGPDPVWQGWRQHFPATPMIAGYGHGVLLPVRRERRQHGFQHASVLLTLG